MQLQELSLESFYRTDDMALVTLLKLEGFTSQQVGWQAGTCYWWFRISDALVTCISVFDSGDARVEPREYSKMFSSTKRDFYDAENPNSAA